MSIRPGRVQTDPPGQFPAGDVNGQVDTVVLVFDEPIDETTVDESLFTLTYTDGDGQQVDRSDAISFVDTFDDTVTVYLDGVGPIGDYQLTLAPGIRDLVGNLMDQDGDDIQGESVDDAYHATFTILSLPDLQVVSGSVAPTSAISGASVCGAMLIPEWTTRISSRAGSPPASSVTVTTSP